MLDPGLSGKVALVTGANRTAGIGAATARALAAQGARVFLHSFGETADEVVGAIRAASGQAECWEADLSLPENVPRLFDRAEETLGPVDVLINNARHWEADTLLPASYEKKNRPLTEWPPPSATVSVESHDRHFAVNSRAVALLLAEYARRFLARGATWGRVVGLTTTGAGGFPRESSYGASKAALESYTRAFALELAPHGVTANLVDPGATQTGWITPELEAEITPKIPMRRVAQPEDVADLIVLLCSDQARLLTGQRIHGLGGRASG